MHRYSRASVYVAVLLAVSAAPMAHGQRIDASTVSTKRLNLSALPEIRLQGFEAVEKQHGTAYVMKGLAGSVIQLPTDDAEASVGRGDDLWESRILESPGGGR